MSTLWNRMDRRGRATRGRTADRRRRRPAGRMHLEMLESRALLTVSVPPSITTDTVEIDDNVVVANPGGSITATGGPSTSGHVQIFGNSKGRIDGTPGESNEDLTITADSFITVTGGIGGIQRPDDLTLTSVTAQPINLQQMVSLTGDLRVTKAGAFTVGSTVNVDGDLVIDEAAMVTFSGNVTVGGNLTITTATGVTFAGMLTVGGALTITNSTGTTRFLGDVSVGSAAVTSTTLVQVMADFTTTGAAGDGDVTFTTDQINFTTASLAASTSTATATLVVQPRTTSRALTIASPPGIPAGLNITDADLTAIQPGWKRVVLGDEAAGTGAVKIGSIGSQYGGFSQILNTTTIVGGTVQVVQPVDVTPLAIYLELVARGTGAPGSGAVTIDAPINQTAEERSAWVRLESAGGIALNAPVWADQIVSLTTTAGGTIAQGGTAAAITATALAVAADGNVTLADSGNAFALVAIKTTNDSVVLREDSGYSISQLTTIDDGRDARPTATVTGIDTGTGTVRLVTVSGGTASTVGQGRAILAGGLGLEGAGTDWNLSLASNDIATLAANTGSIVFHDVDDLTIDTVAAASPQAPLSGITVSRTLNVTAGTTLTITAVGDIVSSATSATAVDLSAPSGIATAGDVTTSGGDAKFNHATTLTGDVTIDVADGANKGTARFLSTVNATTAGQQALAITGSLNAAASIGGSTSPDGALKSLAVSGDSTLAGGSTVRTTGGQTYSGGATSTGTVTVQAGSGAAVRFLGATTLGGLVTSTTDTAAYDVELSGASVTVTNPVTFANTGTVTLGDGSTDDLHFVGGVTSTAPGTTKLAGTVRTTDAAGSFGRKPGGVVQLIADTIVSTGAGNATFGGTVDGAHRLDVNAAGDTTFSSAVGGGTALTHLETDAPGRTLLDGGSVRTASPSSQVYNDDVLLGANTTLTASNSGAVTFAKTLNGDYTLAVDTAGTTTFGGTVGNATPLKSLTTDAAGTTKIDGGSVTTSAAGQVYNDDVELGANTTLTATNSGVVTFAKTLNGDFTLAVATAGTTTFGGTVGNGTPLKSLTTDAAGTTKIVGGSVATSAEAGQVYDDDVELGANTILTATGNGAVTFGETVDADVGGTRTLTVNTQGVTWFAGDVGVTRPLASLTTDAGGLTRITADAVKTTGMQTYNDRVTFEQPPAPQAASTSSIPETLMVGSTVSLLQGLDGAGKSLRIEGNAVFGDQPGAALVINARDAVDPLSNLNGLRVTGDSTINSNLVTSNFNAPANPVVFQGGVTLASDVTIVAGGIWFQSAVSGPGRTFKANAMQFGGPSSIVFDGDVGTTQSPLGPLMVNCLTGAVTINAAIHSTGPVEINGTTIDGDADNAIRTPGGTVSLTASTGIGATTPIAVEAASVTASTTGGGIRLRGIGDLVIGPAGLVAPGVISLDASGAIRVPTGGGIAGGDVVTTKEIRWSVLGTADSGAGSLRQVLHNVNAVGDCNPSGSDAEIVIDIVQPAVVPAPPTVFRLASQLPDVGAAVTLDGTATGMVLDGGQSVSSGLVFREAAAGSVLRGVTLRNFAGFGVQLVGVQNTLVDSVVVQSLNTSTSMGLKATGLLTGTRVVGSTFSGGLRGALLDGARGLVFGEIGRGNVLSNNRAAPQNPKFAGTGIRAQGDCSGTVVSANTFNANNYGFAFVGAQNLRLAGNTFTRNTIAGILVDGNCVGSTQSQSTFGTGTAKNKANIVRSRLSKGV